MADIAASDVTLNDWWWTGEDLHGRRYLAKDVTIARGAATDGDPASSGDDIPASALGFRVIKYAYNGVVSGVSMGTVSPNADGTLLWLKEAASAGVAGTLRCVVVGDPAVN